MPTFLSSSPDETESFAAQFAQSLNPRDVLALHGDLGAGKTRFVRGLLKGLGADPDLVSSPTYILLNIYPTPKFTVYHLDAYRTHTPEDFESIGFLELLDQPALTIVEWPERVTPLLPPYTKHLHLHQLSETKREILY